MNNYYQKYHLQRGVRWLRDHVWKVLECEFGGRKAWFVSFSNVSIIITDEPKKSRAIKKACREFKRNWINTFNDSLEYIILDQEQIPFSGEIRRYLESEKEYMLFRGILTLARLKYGFPRYYDRLSIGETYLSCDNHLCKCEVLDIYEENCEGVSLKDGSRPHSCSLTHCFPERVS